MSEKSKGGEEGKLFYLGIEREKRKFDKAIARLEELLDTERAIIKGVKKVSQDFRPELRADLQKMKKYIIKSLTEGKLDPDKAKEMLARINEAERNIKE